MKQLFIFGVVVFAIVSLWYVQIDSGREELASTQIVSALDVAVDFTATFEVYTEGVRRVFTSPKYHNLSKFVYITPTAPNVVYVKKRGVTWGDFFATLPMKLTYDCITTGTGEKFCTGERGSMKFYVDNKPVSGFLEREIHKGDKAAIHFE